MEFLSHKYVCSFSRYLKQPSKEVVPVYIHGNSVGEFPLLHIFTILGIEGNCFVLANLGCVSVRVLQQNRTNRRFCVCVYKMKIYYSYNKAHTHTLTQLWKLRVPRCAVCKVGSQEEFRLGQKVWAPGWKQMESWGRGRYKSLFESEGPRTRSTDTEGRRRWISHLRRREQICLSSTFLSCLDKQIG